jgi:FixJ family two-component response regulator
VAETPVISVIDDDQTLRESIVDLVRAMGFEAQGFERAEDFLHSGGIARTACLITDMRMPGMSGLELHERLVRDGEAVPTIVITAFPKNDDRARAERSGVVCYLAKPFDHNQLADCIASALERRAASRRIP